MKIDEIRDFVNKLNGYELSVLNFWAWKRLDKEIIRYLEHYGYECELQGDWKPIDNIMKACSDISPRTVKTAEDMKRIVCDEIDKQDTGNVFI